MSALDVVLSAVKPGPVLLRRFSDSLGTSDDPGGNAAEEALHVPGGNGQTQSARGHMSRGEYMHGRKIPQACWLASRLEMMIPGLSEMSRPPTVASSKSFALHILDVGGGRGDLALSLAARFPSAVVTVVDSNASSLAAGETAAAARGLGSRMSFVCQDFADFAASHEPAASPGEGRSDAANNAAVANSFGPVRCLVALHCCGGLSDRALAFAAQVACPFLVVPCCFNKWPIAPFPPWKSQYFGHVRLQHLEAQCGAEEASRGSSQQSDADESTEPFIDEATEQLAVMERLAESDARAVSFKAMSVINALRLRATKHALDGNDEQLQLGIEAFPKDFSLRNMVLVGTPQTPFPLGNCDKGVSLGADKAFQVTGDMDVCLF
jgi:SAM-dependent methyltransferase